MHISSIFFCLAFLCTLQVNGQHEHAHRVDTINITKKPLSPRTFAMAMVGKNHVHIDYGSPSVRGRKIWNGLVAYGQVWATGAHKATWIEFSEDVLINGQNIPKGKYGFFTIPDKKTWTAILSKDWDVHLADDYDPAKDIIRLKVKPKKNKKITEALTYEVLTKNEKEGTIKLSWEYLDIGINFINSQK